MEPTEAEVLQGILDLLILKVIAIEPIHGYGILQRLKQLSREALVLRQGSLYPALYRLERRGWIRAQWKSSSSGREAKFYSLTRTGRARLAAEVAGWNRLTAAVSLVLATAD
jgi:transcriptional regulator